MMALDSRKIEYLCKTRNVCAQCRGDERFRKNVGLPDICPYGLTLDSLPSPIQVREKRMRPGDLLAIAIKRITGIAPCGACGIRKKQMNAWGWWGCWKNRETIVRWIVEEGAKRGYEVSSKSALSLLKGSFLEVRKRRE